MGKRSAAAVGIVALTVLVAGCGASPSAHRNRSAARAVKPDQRQRIIDVLKRYASAYSDHSTQGLAAVFASNIERTSNATGSCVTTRGTQAVLAVYREQFTGTSGRYEFEGLSPRSVSFASGISEEGALEAQATATYRITPPGSHGRIAFVLERSRTEAWTIRHIGVGCAAKVIAMPSTVASSVESGGSTKGPAFLGVEVESLHPPSGTENEYLSGSALSSDQLYGCHPPEEGALIQTVVPNGPAAEAGLRGETGRDGGYGVGGDAIVAIDGSAVLGTESLIAELAARKPGEVAEVEAVRCNGEDATFTVTLGGREDDHRGMSKTEAEVERNAHREEACDENGPAYNKEACQAAEAERRNDGQAREEEQQERRSRMREGSRQYKECERNLHVREATLRKEESETAEPRPKLRHKLQEDAEECAELAEEARNGTDRALREEGE